MIELSVIICTHNPRPDYLDRVLAALRRQTLPTDHWELLLIDNASEPALAGKWDLSWHPHARHIREDELGLTAARLCGIMEARSELLVFVDDDNLLSSNYLEKALDIAKCYAFLGAWGGIIRGEFEIEPEPWLRSLLGSLAIREFSAPIWSNNPTDWSAHPCGAGLCVRMKVAETYSGQLAVNPARRRLDRIGSALSSCGDSDLVQTSCDVGQGFGNFPQLVMTHLIPESRVQPDYLIRLMQGITVSAIVLNRVRFGDLPAKPDRLRVWARYVEMRVRRGRHAARIYSASQKAVRAGIKEALAIGADLEEGQPPGGRIQRCNSTNEPEISTHHALPDSR